MKPEGICSHVTCFQLIVVRRSTCTDDVCLSNEHDWLNDQVYLPFNRLCHAITESVANLAPLPLYLMSIQTPLVTVALEGSVKNVTSDKSNVFSWCYSMAVHL